MSDLIERIAALSPEKRELMLQLLKQKKESISPAEIRPQSRESNSFPLSFAQQRLWFFEQLNPGNFTYHIPAAVSLSGTLSVTALEQSLNELIKRHEVFRTAFTTIDGQPTQIITANQTIKLSEIDLRSLSKTKQEGEVERLILAESQQPFDLSKAPLLRAKLLQLSDSNWVLLFSTHHIISDGWSMGIFIQELATIYKAFGIGEPYTLPDLPVQYADFAKWQREWLQGEVLETQLAYGQKQLGGNLPVLNLPIDRPRPAVQTFRGAVHKFTISKAITEKLTELSQKEKATLFMTLLAAFKTLLYRYTEQEDIVVGSPIANRNRREIEGLIGLFANTLVFRTELSHNPTFKELLGRVREVALGAYSHQDLPFEKLVEILQPERDLSHNPLFQVLFSLRNVDTPQIELPGVTLSSLEIERKTARFDLALDLEEGAEGINAALEYSLDLFDSSTAQRIAGHFLTLLESIVENPAQCISNLPILTKSERDKLLVECNKTQSNSLVNTCIQEVFEGKADKTPDAIAVVFEGNQLTYQQLNRQANQLAHHLKKLGVKPEVPVGIFVERSLEMVVGLLGILKAGGAYVPLDPTHSTERLNFMLEDAQIKVLILQSHLDGKISDKLNCQGINSPLHKVFIDSDWQNIAKENEENLSIQTTPDNLAYIIYTSGSTGKPKGVQVNHRSVVHLFTATLPLFNFNERDAWTVFHSYTFDFSVWEIWGALLNGCKLVIVPLELTQSPAAFYKLLCREKVTILNQTPSAIRQLIDVKKTAENEEWNLRLIVCGGEALPTELASQLLDWNVPLWNFYGPTEATVWTAIHPVKFIESNRAFIPIGRPLPNTQLYILNSNLQPVPVGVLGELYIGGAGLSRGYLNRPELTAEKFIPNPFAEDKTSLGTVSERLYKTGDIARYLPDGTIEFLGRSDHQVKIRGFRIELGEIEAVLTEYPSVREAVVLVREDNPGDKRLVAYIVANTQSVIINDLRVFIKQKLPHYMVPSAFVILDSLPLTTNGKIDRRALPTPDINQAELDSNFAEPRTLEEQLIAEIWGEVLRLERVGIHDNFFELGGHSLLATQAISRLRKAFELDLPLRLIFESPTVATVSDSISQYRADQKFKAPPIKPVLRSEEIPLSFAQQRLWFLDQLQPGNPAYNIPAAVRLKGALNVPAFEQSFQEIIKRHEALRTTFNSVEGRPVQVITSSFNFTLPIVDLRHLSEAEREAEAMRLAGEEVRQAFDLTKGPLLRVNLLQLEATEYLLLLTIHHIVADGWSLGIFVRELATLYEAFCAGKPSPLPELSIQYADYAVWQRNWLQGEVLSAKVANWKQQLGQNLPPLKLPTKQPPHFVYSNQAQIQNFELSKELSEALNALSRQQDTTLFMTLLAALQTLLYRYTNQEDIVVGTDLANRTQVETEALIGFFVNILVLRSNMRGNPTFRQLLDQVREVTLKAYAHQDLPFDKLVEELRPDRSLNQTPLFQVLFVMQNAPMPTLEIADLTLTPVEIDSGTAKFDLALFVTETEGKITGSWKYNSDLFDRETISQISNRFEILLGSIVGQPDNRLNTLELIPEAEKQKQIMQEVKREQSNFSKFKNIKPKVVALPQDELIKTEYLHPNQNFPLIIKPAITDVDLADWAKTNREFIEEKLLKHGAILFRGFTGPVVSAFEQFALSICSELFGEYGDLPREGVSGKVYGSTPYPADKAILFHSESSHLHRWPMKIWFFCVQPAQQGGETPIVDCRKIYQMLDTKLREKFAEKQIMYVRNYTEGLDVSWQDFFKTEEKSVVEKYCQQAGIEFEWKAGNNLITRKIRPAIAMHPKTKEMVFFNQLFLHHISCVDSATRASLLSVFGEENLPRNVYYGDGTPIEDSVMEEIQAIYAQAAVSFPWQAGDIIMLDNMLAAHSRNPFTGPRKIVVAMGEMIAESEV